MVCPKAPAMSVKFITAVMETEIPDGIAKLLAMVLADYANPATGEAWPKIPTLAQHCSQSERTVQRKLRVLEELGVLSIRPNRSGDRKGNMYVLHPRGLGAMQARGTGDRIDGGDRSGNTGDTQSPVPNAGRVTDGHPTGDSAVTRRVTVQSPPLENPSENPSEIPPKPPEDGGTRAFSEFEDGDEGALAGSASHLVEGFGRRERRAGRPRRGEGIAAPLAGDALARYRALETAYPPDGVVSGRQRDAQALFAALSPAEQTVAIERARAYAEACRRRTQHVRNLDNWLRATDFGSPAMPGVPATVDLAEARNAAGLTAIQRGETPIGCSVFVRADSPEATAWEAYFGRFGHQPIWRELGKGLGAYLPALRPPAAEVA